MKSLHIIIIIIIIISENIVINNNLKLTSYLAPFLRYGRLLVQFSSSTGGASSNAFIGGQPLNSRRRNLVARN